MQSLKKIHAWAQMKVPLSNIFWGAWNSWYFLGVNGRCWVRAYVCVKISEYPNPPPPHGCKVSSLNCEEWSHYRFFVVFILNASKWYHFFSVSIMCAPQRNAHCIQSMEQWKSASSSFIRGHTIVCRRRKANLPVKRGLVSDFLTLNIYWRNINFYGNCSLSLFIFFHLLLKMIGLKPNHEHKDWRQKALAVTFLYWSELAYFGCQLMEVNVQMNMTNVKKWQCLIYDCIFSIHYEKKGYNLKETTFSDPQQ